MIGRLPTLPTYLPIMLMGDTRLSIFTLFCDCLRTNAQLNWANEFLILAINYPKVYDPLAVSLVCAHKI